MFGGPGSGKSTTAAALFALMKKAGMNVELVTEFAKDLTWEKRLDVLRDNQPFVLGEQYRRLQVLKGQVDYAVVDSPLILSIIYGAKWRSLPGLVWELWGEFSNYNFFIERTKPYSPVGRNETEAEARRKDVEILDLLQVAEGECFRTIRGDSKAAMRIFTLIARKQV